jgi:ABC-2 type transport system permease protein
MLLKLFAARWRMTVNAHRGRRAWLRSAAVLVLGTAFAGGVWWSSNWFFSQCLTIEPIGQLLVRRALAMTLLTVFSLLAFSALVTAFSTFYLSEDLQLLLARPIPPEVLYTARFWETAVSAAWMIVAFSLPIFLCAGRLLGADAAYYFKLAAVYLALAVIPTSLGVLLSLLLTSVLSAGKARNMFIFAGSLVLGVLLYLLRRLRPEQLMNPDEHAPLIEALQALQGLDPRWLPSSWAIDALWPHLGYGIHSETHPVGLLLATSAASFFVVGWVFRALHPRAFSRSQEGLYRGSGEHRNRRGSRSLQKLAARTAARSTPLGLRSLLAAKDRRVFIRDTAQWSQLLILAAIVAIYLLNFSYIQAITGTGLVSDIGLHFLNLAIGGFVAIALAARFVYPAVSLEGPAFWLIRSSPNAMLDFLRAKSRSWTVRLVVFANLLLIATHLLLRTDPLLSLASLVTVTPLAVGVVWLGIGLGARNPRLEAPSAVAVAAGLGGVLFMLSAAFMLVVQVLASIAPTVMLVRLIRRGFAPSGTALGTSLAGAVIVFGLPLLVGGITLRIGARHLERLD